MRLPAQQRGGRHTLVEAKSRSVPLLVSGVGSGVPIAKVVAVGDVLALEV